MFFLYKDFIGLALSSHLTRIRVIEKLKLSIDVHCEA